MKKRNSHWIASMYQRKSVRDALAKVLQVMYTYDEIAEGYTHWRARPWAISKLAGNGIILDLGSGACVNGIYAYKNNGRYLICLDISYAMSSLAKNMLNREGVLGDSVNSDMVFLPIRSNSVNNILAIASIHHIPKELLPIVFREIRRAAVCGAIVVITIWSWRQPRFIIPTIVNFIEKVLNPLKRIREYRVAWRRRGRTLYRYYYLYTLEEIMTICRRFGLRILSYGYTGYVKKRSDNIYIVARVLKQLEANTY